MIQVTNVLTVIDVDGWQFPRDFKDAIEGKETYRDTGDVLKEHLYSIDLLEDDLEGEEPELAPYREVIAELRQEADKHEASYFRIVFD